MGTGEAYAGFWWKNLRERDHLEDPGEDGRMIVKWIFKNWGMVAWTGSIWLRMTDGGHV